jgi:hypothetical protein
MAQAPCGGQRSYAGPRRARVAQAFAKRRATPHAVPLDCSPVTKRPQRASSTEEIARAAKFELLSTMTKRVPTSARAPVRTAASTSRSEARPMASLSAPTSMPRQHPNLTTPGFRVRRSSARDLSPTYTQTLVLPARGDALCLNLIARNTLAPLREKKKRRGKGDTEKKSSSSPLYELSARDFWSSRYPVDAFSSAWHAAAGAQN